MDEGHANTDLSEDDLEVYNEKKQETIEMVDRKLRGIAWSRARRLIHKGPRQLNILTIDQKRRLIHLANDREDPWPLDRLAQNFQISVDSVKKLLKSAWLPTDPEAIQRHDDLVIERRKQMGLSVPKPPHTATSIAKKCKHQFAFSSLGALPAASHRAGSLTRIVMSDADLSKAAREAAAAERGGQEQPEMVSRMKRGTRMSAVFSRRETVHLSPPEVDGEGYISRLQVDVHLPRRPMTLSTLKRRLEKMELDSRLKQPQTFNKPLT